MDRNSPLQENCDIDSDEWSDYPSMPPQSKSYQPLHTTGPHLLELTPPAGRRRLSDQTLHQVSNGSNLRSFNSSFDITNMLASTTAYNLAAARAGRDIIRKSASQNSLLNDFNLIKISNGSATDRQSPAENLSSGDSDEWQWSNSPSMPSMPSMFQPLGPHLVGPPGRLSDPTPQNNSRTFNDSNPYQTDNMLASTTAYLHLHQNPHQHHAGGLTKSASQNTLLNLNHNLSHNQQQPMIAFQNNHTSHHSSSTSALKNHQPAGLLSLADIRQATTAGGSEGLNHNNNGPFLPPPPPFLSPSASHSQNALSRLPPIKSGSMLSVNSMGSAGGGDGGGRHVRIGPALSEPGGIRRYTSSESGGGFLGVSCGAVASVSGGVGQHPVSIKEFESKYNELKRENFNLKLRIYLLEKEKTGISKPEYESEIARELHRRDKAVKALEKVLVERERIAQERERHFRTILSHHERHLEALKTEKQAAEKELHATHSHSDKTYEELRAQLDAVRRKNAKMERAISHHVTNVDKLLHKATTQLSRDK